MKRFMLSSECYKRAASSETVHERHVIKSSALHSSALHYRLCAVVGNNSPNQWTQGRLDNVFSCSAAEVLPHVYVIQVNPSR
jgi:hypothetical protein